MKQSKYCYVIKLKWEKGGTTDIHVLSICSSVKMLRYVLLDIILDLQNKYIHVDQNYARFTLAEAFKTEYHKHIDDVIRELKKDNFSSMIKYRNSPEKYEGIWDEEHVAYELTIEKQLMNTWFNPVADIF